MKNMILTRSFIGFGVVILVLISFAPAAISAPKPFWEGKTLTFIVDTPPSGGADLYARHIARYLPKHLPGKPIAIVSNITEGGSIGALNRLYHTKPDGLTIGYVNRAIVVNQLVGQPGIRFDLSKLSWIGSPTQGETVFYVRADRGWNSFADMQKSNKVINSAASRMGTAPYQFQRSIELAFKMKFNIVFYPGTGDRMLAIERGEVDAGTLDTDPFLAEYKHLLDRGVVKIFMQTGLQTGLPTGPERNKDFPNVPTVDELLRQLPTDPTGALVMRAFVDTTVLGRPYACPPGTPKDRLDPLIRAFEETMKDPGYLAEAEKLRVTPKPISAEKIAQMVRGVLNSPPEVTKLFSQMFKE